MLSLHFKMKLCSDLFYCFSVKMHGSERVTVEDIDLGWKMTQGEWILEMDHGVELGNDLRSGRQVRK